VFSVLVQHTLRQPVKFASQDNSDWCMPLSWLPRNIKSSKSTASSLFGKNTGQGCSSRRAGIRRSRCGIHGYSAVSHWLGQRLSLESRSGFCGHSGRARNLRSSIKSLKDFKPTDKIALPSPGSVQHILLAMAAEKELGSASALDQNLVAMAHPDGAAA